MGNVHEINDINTHEVYKQIVLTRLVNFYMN